MDELTRAVALALGALRCAESNDQICCFRTADSYLGLFPYDHLAADAGLAGAQPETFGDITLAINVETPKAVGQTLNDAVNAGAMLVKNPFLPLGADGRISIR